MQGIYEIRNVTNGKRYIGSSIHIERRWLLHKSQLRNKQHHSLLLQRAWNKYGEENFVFVILRIVDDRDDLVSVEQEFLDELKPAYNRSPSAGSTRGRKVTAKSRALMSAAKKGIAPMHATEAAARVTRGTPRTPEVRAKIAASKRGKKRPDVALRNRDPAFRQIVSDSNKGRPPWAAINAAAEARRKARQQSEE